MEITRKNVDDEKEPHQDVEVLRYKVSMKKGYRITNIILGICLVAFSIPVTIFSFKASVTAVEYVFSFGAGLFFIVTGVSALLQPRKKLAVYKGRIEYCNGFCYKKYSLSDVYEYNTRLVDIKTEYGDGTVKSGGWDKISTFYGKDGKKLFQFGLAYNNLDRFKKEIENCRKSIKNNKKI